MSSKIEAADVLIVVRMTAEVAQTHQTLYQLDALLNCIGDDGANRAEIKALHDALDERFSRLLRSYERLVYKYTESTEGGAE